MWPTRFQIARRDVREVQLFLSTARAMGVQLPVTLQQQYSLAYREIEYEVVPAALYNGIGLLPSSPLAAGFLSGNIYAATHRATADVSPPTIR